MKISKIFLAGLAGLAMFSCSSDDEIAPAADGNSAVSIQVARVLNGRAVVDATQTDNNSKVWVDGDVKVTVTTGSDERTATLTFKDGVCSNISVDNQVAATYNTNTGVVKFWNIPGVPSKVTAAVNEGAKDITDITPFISTEAAKVPAYAEATPASIGQEVYQAETGFTAQGNPDGKTYQMYKAELQLTIPFARIEASGLKHVDAEGSTCAYKTLDLAHVYLDKAATTKDGDVFDVDPVKEPNNWGSFYDEVSGSFLSGNVFPTEGKVYAYNVWPGNAPTLKLHFNNATSNEEGITIANDQYAFITKYVDASTNKEINQFEAGVIYRIVSAQIEDKNIGPDEEGNTQYAITVLVKAASWSIVNVNTEWHDYTK